MSKGLKIILCIIVVIIGAALIIYTIYYNVNVLIDLNSPASQELPKNEVTESSESNNIINNNYENTSNSVFGENIVTNSIEK